MKEKQIVFYCLKIPYYSSINLKCVFSFSPLFLLKTRTASHSSIFISLPAVLSIVSPSAACSGRCKGFTLLIFPKQTPEWFKATRRGAEHEHSSQGASWGSHYSPCPRNPLWVTVWAFISTPSKLKVLLILLSTHGPTAGKYLDNSSDPFQTELSG